MAFDVQAALSEILENEKRQKIVLLPDARPPDKTLPSTPLQVGTVNSKGKHIGKVAMQKITACQAIEHGASNRTDLTLQTGWGHIVTTRVLNTLIRSCHVSESNSGILSLNTVTYRLFDRLIKAGHLNVVVTHSRRGA